MKMYLISLVTACLAAAGLNAQPWQPFLLVDDPYLDPYSQFGEEVVLEGDTLVVSAPGGVGAVFVFARNTGGMDQWELCQELLPDPDQTLGGPGSGGFGDGLAYNGRDLLVGSENGVWHYLRNEVGAFVRVSAVESGILAPPVASLALQDTLLVRGGRQQLSNIEGSVAVYRRTDPLSTEWELAAVRSHMAVLQFNSCFGTQVILQNGTIVVSDPCRGWDDQWGNGAASIYRWLGGLDSLAPAGGVGVTTPWSIRYDLSRSIAFDGDTVLAGTGTTEVGGEVLALAVQNGTQYEHVRTFGGDMDAWGLTFLDVGHALHVHGPVIITGTHQGLAFLEKRYGETGNYYGPDDDLLTNNDSTWVQLRVDTLPGPVERLARSGEWLAAGMPLAKAVYLYRDVSLSIPELRPLSSLTVHPVPARDHVTLTWHGVNTRGTVVELRDTAGRLMAFQRVPPGAATMSLARNGMAHGIYLVRLMDDHGRTLARTRLLWQ